MFHDPLIDVRMLDFFCGSLRVFPLRFLRLKSRGTPSHLDHALSYSPAIG
jgi:hypothetical protein